MMGEPEPDPDQEPECEEWMDAPIEERLSDYRYFFVAGGCLLLLLVVPVFIALLAFVCGAPGTCGWAEGMRHRAKVRAETNAPAYGYEQDPVEENAVITLTPAKPSQ
jgi:hypothetical protein